MLVLSWCSVADEDSVFVELRGQFECQCRMKLVRPQVKGGQRDESKGFYYKGSAFVATKDIHCWGRQDASRAEWGSDDWLLGPALCTG
ncbi:hypothetical protein BM1_03516 [Bipolaris maydis]|nr:hypothetical protein BM1_03516 [Bipolaris maydis]